MPSERWRHLFSFVLLAVTALAPYEALAQAWVDDPGALSAGIDYTFAPSNDVIKNSDESYEGHPITAHGVTLSAEYTPIENLGVSVSLPFLAVKYGGDTDPSFPRHGSYDDGDFHSTLTDLRSTIRYNVLKEPLVQLTPHVGFSIPLADYETVGFATAGRHLKQLHLGASIARTFSPSLPMAFFHGSFEWTFAERYDQSNVTKAFGQNRSDSTLLFGYFFLEGKLNVNLGGNLRLAHGNGIDFTDIDAGMVQGRPLPADAFMYHDPILREEFLLVGAGAAYALTEKLQLSGQFRYFTWGNNTRDATIVGLGLNWSVL